MDFIDDVNFIDNRWFVVAWKNNMHGEQQGGLHVIQALVIQALSLHQSKILVPVLVIFFYI